MLYKTTSIGTQYASLHPDLRAVLADLDAQLESWGMGPLVVTDAIRTPQENTKIYSAFYFGRGLSREDAAAKAASRFSWHMVGAAADFRGTSGPYSAEDCVRIGQWLAGRCERPLWETLEHDVGKGRHFHLARCDYGWRKEWEKKGVGA